MQLNGELIDVTGDFGPLGFVFFQLPAQFGEMPFGFLRIARDGRNIRNLRGLAALLTGKR